MQSRTSADARYAESTIRALALLIAGEVNSKYNKRSQNTCQELRDFGSLLRLVLKTGQTSAQLLLHLTLRCRYQATTDTVRVPLK